MFHVKHLKIPPNLPLVRDCVTMGKCPVCHSEPFACHSEPIRFAQGKLREESDTGCHPERSEGSHEFLRLTQGRLREESQRINRLDDRDSSAKASE